MITGALKNDSNISITYNYVDSSNLSFMFNSFIKNTQCRMTVIVIDFQCDLSFEYPERWQLLGHRYGRREYIEPGQQMRRRESLKSHQNNNSIHRAQLTLTKVTFSLKSFNPNHLFCCTTYICICGSSCCSGTIRSECCLRNGGSLYYCLPTGLPVVRDQSGWPKKIRFLRTALCWLLNINSILVQMELPEMVRKLHTISRVRTATVSY